MKNRDEYVDKLKAQLDHKDLARGTDEAWARMREACDKASSHFRTK